MKDQTISKLTKRKLEHDDTEDININPKEFDIAYNANIVINALKQANIKNESSPHEPPNIQASTNVIVEMDRSTKTVKNTQKRSMIPRRLNNSGTRSISHYNIGKRTSEQSKLQSSLVGFSPVKCAPIAAYSQRKKRTAQLLSRCQ